MRNNLLNQEEENRLQELLSIAKHSRDTREGKELEEYYFINLNGSFGHGKILRSEHIYSPDFMPDKQLFEFFPEKIYIFCHTPNAEAIAKEILQFLIKKYLAYVENYIGQRVDLKL